ncbi:MAG: alpha-L-fucosidase [Actinophytocola sp.]|uniref:alpha-L-fucosidase n=1 Tax=Actinophytocola sp. TaxID=1872138 RepID=UPI001328B525|nr:alpha-L-fucosidase [Actinophytocola sp.]MPZ81310.1 alpha-L-fucosidase [Actinophytocola sp.]
MSRRHWLIAALTLLTVTTLPATLPATPATAAPQEGPGANYAVDDAFTADRTQWWRDDRFGMFIHFGAYSNLEGEYTRPDGTVCRNAEWIQRECQIPKEDYERIAADFDPAGFDADAIAQAAADAGQKYVVITSKHHEGYAMWPTEVNDWNLRDHSSFDPTRDILAELKAATEKRGIKLGFYYSIWDWHDPDFPDPATFPRYEQRMYAQLKELVDNYDPAVLWFDGEWSTDRPNNPWTDRDGERLEAYVRSLSPDIVINNRVGKRRVVDGDTGTPEQEIPDAPVAGQLWESCMTLNGSWGFARWDTNWKSPTELTRNLAGIAGRSGNYLLNVGPDATGRIPAESVSRLRTMGDWLRTNGRAVYGAHAPGIVAEPAWGAVSRRGDRLYASVYDWPATGGSLRLDALAPFQVTGARVLGSDQRVDARRDGDVVTITPSGGPTSDIATVVELTVRTARPAGAARGTGLSASFWPNATFTGDPTVTRTDPGVNYNWKYTGSPDPAIPAEPFSSVWTGQVEAPFTETYTFTTVSDDTVRLWVDGRLVIDNTTPHGPTVDQGTIALRAGHRHAIRLEQTEQGGEASMKLIWSSPNIAQEVVPAARLYRA